MDIHRFYNGSLNWEVGAHLQCRDILLADVICLREAELFSNDATFFLFNICGTLKKHKSTTTTLQAANCFLVENTV